nr:M10 family metallopeptidase C-terminal domain-containing protein [Donghicola mangrovi]
MCTICEELRPQASDCDFQSTSETVSETDTVSYSTGASSSGASLSEGTLDELAAYLIEGYWSGTGSSSRSFASGSSTVITVDLSELTSDGQQLARWAFQMWEMVADIQFEEVTSGTADITFSDDYSGAYCNTTYSGDTITSAFVNVSKSWLNSYGSSLDSYSFSTYVHEIGHALGLGHMGDYNGYASYADDAVFANDSYQISVMSYFSQTENPTVDADYADPVTAMMADILAIQTIYGAAGSSSATAGDTVYGVGTTLDNIFGYLLESAITSQRSEDYTGDAVAVTLYDYSGEDTLDFSSLSTADSIDLREESFSDLGGQDGVMGIARGTVIENAYSGGGNDSLYGNGVGNLLNAGTGNDTAYGYSGNDTLEGEDGNDRLFGGSGADSISGGDGNDYLAGNSQRDLLEGGDGSDTLISGSGWDTAYGGAGNDTLSGNGGRDRLYGGEDADLLKGGRGGDKQYGGTGDDRLYGNGGNDRLYGNEGDDTLSGGNGRDVLEGGAGDDFLRGGLHADTFVFNAGDGDDTIADFSGTQGDVLQFSADLWDDGADAGFDLNLHLSVASGDTVITFDTGDSVVLLNVTDLAMVVANSELI